MKEKNKLDLLVLFIIPLIATVLSLYFHVHHLVSTFLFFGLPALYLTLRTKGYMISASWYAFVFGVLSAMVIDMIAVFDASWYTPSDYSLIFGIVPVEDIIWGFLVAYSVIIFYYHFFMNKPYPLFTQRMKLFFMLSLLLFMVAGVLHLFVKNPVKIPYFYLIGATLTMLVPVLLMLFLNPEKIPVYTKTGAYFFFLFTFAELTALHLGLWQFPGSHFIGWVEIVGQRFPIEEFIFTMFLIAPALLVYLEFLAKEKA